ncbi:MAG: hypothetical protein ACK5O7_05715 [Holosporales bacterium]
MHRIFTASILLLSIFSAVNASNQLPKPTFLTHQLNDAKASCKKKINILREKQAQLEKERSQQHLSAALKPNVSLDAVEQKIRVEAEKIESNTSSSTHTDQIKHYAETCDLLYQDTRAQLDRYEAEYQKIRMERKNNKIIKTGH